MARLLLVVLPLIRLYQCWFCGGVRIEDGKECKCGSEVLTWKYGIYNGEQKTACCGPDTCTIDTNGDGICTDGIPCNTSRWDPWNCGDVIIAQEKTCQCGSSSPPLASSQYKDHGTWCCPSEPCSYQDDGTAVCQNATVVKGSDKGCNGGVCYSRDHLPCKSGNQCVAKSDICHGGAPLCDDGSDLAECSPDNDEDICHPDYNYSKCPAADIPVEHQECYHSVSLTNNKEYDCITRGDETQEDKSSSETIDYQSITPCNDNGLKCGSKCLYISKWCNPYLPWSTSCTTNTTTFSADNPILCQNRTFWQNISCDIYENGKLTDAGYRCKGRHQHCYYPSSSPKFWLPDNCYDRSDQIVRIDEGCSQEINKDKDECQCQKTKDEKNYFQCPINHSPHCIHPKLVCDGHPACDNSEDESLSQECIEKLTKLNTIKPTATKVCTSKTYTDNKMKIVAVACDGVEECLDAEDEGWLCINSSIPFYGTMFFCGMLLLTLIVYKLYKGAFNERMEDSELLVLPDILNEFNFEKNHNKRKFQDDINVFIQASKVLDSKCDRIVKIQKLYELELKIHEGNIAETRLCLKKTLDWSNAKILMEAAFPGFLFKHFKFIDNFLEKIDKLKLSYWIFNKVKTIFNIYLDICKDTILTVTILFVIGGPTSLYYFPTKLTSVVVYCFMVSIIIPLVCSSILHTQRVMENQKEISFSEKILKYCQSLLLSPLRPLILAESYEENKAKRRSLIRFDKNREFVLRLNEEGRKLGKYYSKFVRVDLGLEVVFQLSGQILYLLLSSTNTPTTGGLEEMFKQTSDVFLALSIGLSVKTICFVTLKTISIVKPFLPFTTKMVLLSWIMVSASTRVMTIVLFFTPSFGLFSILGHWKLEQTPYSKELNNRFKTNSMVYLYNTTTFAWTDLNRYNYTSKRAPNYTVYTYYTLQEYFVGFWVLLLIHTYTNLKAVLISISQLCSILFE